MKPKHWLFLGLATAAVAESAACSSSFKSCNDSRTCAPAVGAGTGGLGDAGDTSQTPEAGAPTESEGGSAGVGGQGGDGAVVATPDAGAGGEGGAVGAVCDASVDLDADPKNCGRCGHDCLGGECYQAQCKPTVVAADQDEPGSLTTDGTYIYWAGTHDANAKTFYVARRRIDGSDAAKEIASSETQLPALTLSPTMLYWVDTAHVRGCSAPDCSEGAHDILETKSTRCIDALFANANSTLYWSCNSNYRANDGSLWALALPGTSDLRVEPNSGNPQAMTSDAENLYWGNSAGFNSENQLGSDGAIWRLALKTGARTKLVSALNAELNYLAAAGGWLYFSSYPSQQLQRIPLPYGAATPSTIADGLVTGTMADDHAIYWSDCEKGVINRCPHAGCQKPDTIVVGQTCPRLLAQDAASIYWLNSGNLGATVESYPIQRLAK